MTLGGPGLAENHPVHPETLRFCSPTAYILLAYSFHKMYGVSYSSYVALGVCDAVRHLSPHSRGK
jgi:hypothetical protein